METNLEDFQELDKKTFYNYIKDTDWISFYVRPDECGYGLRGWCREVLGKTSGYDVDQNERRWFLKKSFIEKRKKEMGEQNEK